jgi:hypothetical protein
MFNLAPTLRALTAGSPITTALHEARRMAQQYRERGGAAVSAQGTMSAGFLLPADIDAVALAVAIEATLRTGSGAKSDRSSTRLNLLERRSGGQLVVPRMVLERLGTGDAACGEKVLKHLMKLRASEVVGEPPRAA